MTETWLVAILPLMGVVIGAILQFWLRRTVEREKHAAGRRSQAHADYLRAVATAAHLASHEDLRDAHRDVADAKARMAVYGSVAGTLTLGRYRRALRCNSAALRE